jgi:hypothetical protein
MWLHYENPCSRTTARDGNYPPTVAYCCFQPRDSASLTDLARLAIETLAALHPDWPATFVGLRPYDSSNTYTCEPQFAADLIAQHPGEAYAFVPCVDPTALHTALEQTPHSEESSLVHLQASCLVIFLHDGHDSIEILGAPAEVHACARLLFDQHSHR